MESFLVVSVVVVAYVLLDLRRSHNQAPVRAIELLARVERSVGVSVPLEVRDRLHLAVARRLRWPVFARSAGYVVLMLSGVLFGALDGPLGERSSWLIGLLAGAGYAIATATGELVAHVAVGYRGFPADPQHPRAARAEARLLADFVAPLKRLAWAISSVALVAVLPLALVVTRAFPPALPVLVLCLGSALLTLGSWLALRLLLRRPLPGLREERVWQEALLADSLQQVTVAAAGVNAFTVLLSLGAVAVLHDDLNTPTLVAASGVLVGALAAIAFGVRSVSWRAQPPVLQRRDVLT
jgi:hypothetical protein